MAQPPFDFEIPWLADSKSEAPVKYHNLSVRGASSPNLAGAHNLLRSDQEPMRKLTNKGNKERYLLP